MSTGSISAFAQSGVVTLAASTTSAGAALAGTGDTVLVSNPAAAVAWVALSGGSGPPTAVVGTGYPVLPGARRLIASAMTVTQAAVILTTGTGNVYVETGSGSAT